MAFREGLLLPLPPCLPCPAPSLLPPFYLRHASFPPPFLFRFSAGYSTVMPMPFSKVFFFLLSLFLFAEEA